MTGAFYGSLAASASVFVAILTALLVNNYVQIKSDRRQVKNELSGIKEDLEGLEDQRDNHQETVDALVEKREADYREKAKKQVKEFIDSKIPSEYSKPIENLSVGELYQGLINFHHHDTPEELEDSPIKPHHRELLEDQIDDIEDKILNEIVPAFASKYEGRGWDPELDPDHTSLIEKLEAMEDAEDETSPDDESGKDQSEENEPDIVVEADLEREVLNQEEFINKYREKYGLDSLDDKTLDTLKAEYDDIVDQNPYHGPSSSSTSLDSALNPYSNLQPGFIDAVSSLAESGGLNEPMADIDFEAVNSVLGLNIQEQQKLERSREKLQEKKNEIQVLKQRKNRLEDEKQRLHPEDLLPILTVNGATIILSVVIPIFAYLLFVTNTAVTVPWIISHTEVNVFLSWLLGLLVVFDSIHARINEREPEAYSLYKRVRNGLSRD